MNYVHGKWPTTGQTKDPNTFGMNSNSEICVEPIECVLLLRMSKQSVIKPIRPKKNFKSNDKFDLSSNHFSGI